MFNFHTQPDDGLISPKTWLISGLMQMCVPGKHWFYYEQRHTKTRLFSFPWVEKVYSDFQVEKEKRQDEWKME